MFFSRPSRGISLDNIACAPKSSGTGHNVREPEGPRFVPIPEFKPVALTEIIRRPLSAIIKEMAQILLIHPERVPSSEAMHASLLFAHAAWARATSPKGPPFDYRRILRRFQASNPGFWSELKSLDTEALVRELVGYKHAHFREDRRQIVVCGMRGNNVHVEWFDPAIM